MTMNVAQFLLDANACSSRIQMLAAQRRGWTVSPMPTDEDYATKVQTIMDDLALRGVVVIDGELTLDVTRLGVDDAGTLRIETERRWDRPRIVRTALLAAGVVLVGIVVGCIAFGLGHDLGMRDVVASVQLPTR